MFIVLSLAFIGLGIACIVSYFLKFKVPTGYVLIKEINPAQLPRVLTEGWHSGVKPPNENLILVERKAIAIPPRSDDFIELRTPDDGILGIQVNITYGPDIKNRQIIKNYTLRQNIEKSLESRVRSALNSWIQQKPSPGTLKRAIVRKEEAEEFLKARLTNSNGNALAVIDSSSLYGLGIGSVNELGISIDELHITDMQELEKGTGKPNWGDDDLIFDADKVRFRLKQKVSSVSELRKEKKALLEEFPDEEDYIETLYEEELIQSKEHRDQ
jgi:hypothetical protein